MARPTNRQIRSVGNLGDILKHAALTELASLLAESHSPVAYVDTHTFLLHAPIADEERWNREVGGLLAAQPAYARYVELERRSLAQRARYRCSSGLVMDVLGDGRAGATLGEANGLTRAELRAQLAEERLGNVVVTDDAAAALRAPLVGGEGALLLHLDPFSLPPALWASLAPALDAVCSRGIEVVLIAYRYTRSAPSPWPPAPRGTLGPVAQVRGGPHEVAAFASSTIAARVREVCGSLGWATAVS